LFLDQAKIHLTSGKGGSGVVSFRREKYVPRGGPDGGDGGRGGHIILLVDPNLNTLSNFRYQQHFKAENGLPGEACNRTGKDGSDLYITVPSGTIVKDIESHQILADLTFENPEFVILRGGRGGRGNSRFATSTRQTPQFAEKAELGTDLWVELELKLIADVGLIGFPNAGKSTLLSKISAAKPKIADYPFTTLIPNLGVVDFKGESFVAVDIPGLIEGAHQGVGLGHQFLRHIERTRLLVHLIDFSGLSGRDPYDDYLQINEELRLFNPALAEKPQLIVSNKMDIPEAEALLEAFLAKTELPKVFPLSAATSQGIEPLLSTIIQKLSELPKILTTINMFTEEAPFKEDLALKISKEDQFYLVKNKSLERRIIRYDLQNDESVNSLQRFLKRWGVFTALQNAGISEGDQVRIGEFEFIYYDED